MVYEINYTNGYANGEEKLYSASGELLAKINYYNDEKHGRASLKKKESSQMIDCIYRYGILISTKL
jgi:antitoxin component YwqK of YwqJK toxin-antitoxin module